MQVSCSVPFENFRFSEDGEDSEGVKKGGCQGCGCFEDLCHTWIFYFSRIPTPNSSQTYYTLTKRDSLPWQVLYKYIEGCYRLGHYLFSTVSCATASIIAGFLGEEQGSFLSMSATKEAINRTCGHQQKSFDRWWLKNLQYVYVRTYRRHVKNVTSHLIAVLAATQVRGSRLQENSLSISLGMSSSMQGPRPSPPERPHKKLWGSLGQEHGRSGEYHGMFQIWWPYKSYEGLPLFTWRCCGFRIGSITTLVGEPR